MPAATIFLILSLLLLLFFNALFCVLRVFGHNIECIIDYTIAQISQAGQMIFICLKLILNRFFTLVCVGASILAIDLLWQFMKLFFGAFSLFFSCLYSLLWGLYRGGLLWLHWMPPAYLLLITWRRLCALRCGVSVYLRCLGMRCFGCVRCLGLRCLH